MEFYTTVDDELFAELSELIGQKVVFFEVWEDSLADDLEKATPTDAPNTFDIDLYLADGIYFELYSTACFLDLEADPWIGQETVRQRLGEMMRVGLELHDVAVDQEDGLILILAKAGKPALYLSIAGWLVEEWDELPE